MTAALDPTEVIAAAGQELLDRLRDLVDRETVDDVPAFLDELSKLTRRARGRITRARKRAEAETAPKTPPAEPRATDAADANPAAVPAVAPVAPAGDRVTVRLDEPTTDDRPPATGSTPSWLVATELARTTPDTPPRRAATRRWAYLLALILLGVLGVAIAVTTGSPLGLTGAVGAVLAVAGWRAHRQHQERAR